MRLIAVLFGVFSLLGSPSFGQDPERNGGPVFAEFGTWSPIDNEFPVPESGDIKVIYDVTRGADEGDLNRRIDSAARFINMLVHEGVDRERIKFAVVSHGPSMWDLTTPEAYARKYPNRVQASAAAVEEMAANGVAFYICGQAAIYHGITNDDLLPGVKMALSQPIATATLHMQGYTNIP